MKAIQDQEEQLRSEVSHDEAFKKLLEVFFKEFIELFFPQLMSLLDFGHARFLMQELLVDIVGEQSRSLDLLLETKSADSSAFVLVHLEPQSYRDPQFHERMFIYYSRLFERHRTQHKLIIPIAIFTADEGSEEPDKLVSIAGDHEILRFHFFKIELRRLSWRRFVDSANPVAAALLAKMGYNKKEKREMRLHYLRMLLKLRNQLDEARLQLVMSVGDLYFKPDKAEDRQLLDLLAEEFGEEEAELLELMPAWKRWGYEEGLEEGLQQGMEKGVEKGLMLGKADMVQKLLNKGFQEDDIADMLDIPLSEVDEMAKISRPSENK
ncbi:Rpn family recombination-promoting nuclease/putative transposase [Paenibacillus oryzae]|uniref:Rpn family recombination-promoting nuclease/putative transposase n=1 Tax=Paenibacillus oryzae TaxID=1844972 RepID=UPI0009EE1C08|nr:Rpn family recombination-promoting nuclease/putative transposase [Paenibacillus oryzae]